MDKISLTVFVTGLIFLIISSILNWIIVPNIIDDKIKEEVRLINGTETWKKWQNIPVPIYLKFYIFNVTNPDDVELGEKPILEEIGPYTYREYRVKYDIKLFPFEDMVSYKQKITYFFEREKSAGCESDKFSVVNIPFISLATITNKMMGPGVTNWVMWLLRVASLGGETLIKRNVHLNEFLFDGFDVSLYSKPLDSIRKLFPSLNIELPSEFQNNKFGIYNGRNGTSEGVFTIVTGTESPSNFGEILSINGEQELKFWGESQVGGMANACNQINGSDGTLFHPFIRKDSVLNVYNKDLCRSFPFAYEKEIEFEGVSGYRFVIPLEVFEDPKINPENLCYCPASGGNANYCLPGGCVRLRSCKKDAPIVLSLPHFLDGDEVLRRDVVGLQPNKTKHKTFLDVEPNTGLSLRTRKRLQFNVEINRMPNVDGLKHAREMVFPFIWVEEYADLDDDNINELKSRFLTPLMIFTIGKWGLIGLGSAIVASSLLICFLRRKRSKVVSLKI